MGLADSAGYSVNTSPHRESEEEFVTKGGPFAEWKNEGEELEILAREAQQGHQGPWHPLCPDEDPTKWPNLEFEQVISEVT